MADLIKLSCPSCGSRLDAGKRQIISCVPNAEIDICSNRMETAFPLYRSWKRCKKAARLYWATVLPWFTLRMCIWAGREVKIKKRNQVLKKRSNARSAENSSALRILSDVKTATDRRSAFRTKTRPRIFVQIAPSNHKVN